MREMSLVFLHCCSAPETVTASVAARSPPSMSWFTSPAASMASMSSNPSSGRQSTCAGRPPTSQISSSSFCAGPRNLDRPSTAA
uniref:Uncharacterized protein n=1 Tax=Arundo donax TaxID=35708 RepID=A0A0A9DCI6_ARUDO